MQQLKKILFDLGANNGNSIRKFSKELSNFSEFEVYSFEPGTIADSQEMRDTLLKFPNVTLCKSAVLASEEEIVFYEHTKNSSASTASKKKATDKNRPGDCGSNIKGKVIERKVMSVDFPKFMEEKIHPYDNLFVVVKMDIEASEWVVVPAMLKEDLFEHVDQFHVEWHREWKVGEAGAKMLTDQIKLQNPKILIDEHWNAMGW